MDWNEMSTLYREPPIDASYPVSKKSANKKQESAVAPCLLTNREGLSKLYRRPSIDASYQVSDHLAKRFQRRIFLEIDNQKQELPVVAMFVNGSGRNEHSLSRTAHRCLLPSFGSFGQAVSEERIFRNRTIGNKNCL
jgi:hypothetical protein